LPELYDLEADPNELHNLAKDSAYLITLASLETQLTQVLEAEGLTPDTDKIPIDEGIKTQLPDQKIR
jgi:N-acetylglucosamine-6-sulfatase